MFYPLKNGTTYIQCDLTGEDPYGADSVLFAYAPAIHCTNMRSSFASLSVEDHLHYLGVDISTEGCYSMLLEKQPPLRRV